MKNNKVFRRIASCLMLALMLFGIMAVPAAYADGETGSITVKFPINDAMYQIFKIGHYENGEIVMEPDFMDFCPEPEMPESELAEMAQYMADHVEEEGLSSVGSAKVIGERAYFRNIPEGIYLLVGEKSIAADGNTEVIPIPSIVPVPVKVNGEPQWNVVVENKYTTRYPTQDIKVTKKWMRPGGTVGGYIELTSGIPEYVYVQLVQKTETGTSYYGGSVRLDATNNWSYTWSGLPANITFSVVEIGWIYGYETYPHITVQDNEFIIENRKLPPILPQTGQLWWPVYALVGVGMVFLVIGMIQRRKCEEENA